MAKSKKVSYRVVRGERVGIGSFDATLVRGEIVDSLPDDVLQALLDGQFIEEIDPKDDADG